MKKTRYLLVFVALGFVLASCGDKPADQKSEQTQKVAQSSPGKQTKPACDLTMGWDPWEPYQYLTPDNQVRGLEIDLISSIAKQADCTITFVQNDWMRLLKGIRNGSVDMLGGASKTASREEFAHFSTPYRHESFVLYIRNEQKNEFAGKSLQQLLENKFKLGVTEDYIYGDEVSDFQDNPTLAPQIIGVPITEMNYFNLIQHQIDGFLEDPFVAAYTIKRKGLTEKVMATTIGYDSGDVSFMFSKKSVSTEIVDAFNRGLETIKASGEYDKILKKYSH
jgi:polar amino acid transport system substrate-binding protein